MPRPGQDACVWPVERASKVRASSSLAGGLGSALSLGILAILFPGQPLLGLSLDSAVGSGNVDAGVDTLPRWFVGIHYERELISSDLPAWTDWTQSRASVTRELSSGAIGVEAAHFERFGRRDVGLTLDAYRNLWGKSYGNVWLRMAPGADVLPNVDARVEIFQGVAGAWEVSGSYRRMDFDATDVGVVGVGLARYVRDWYLRVVSGRSTVAGRSTWSFAGTARRLLNPPREYIDLSGGLGREATIVGPGPTVELRRSHFLQVRIQSFLSAHWGVVAAASHNRFEGTPVRRAFSIGLITRF